MLRRSLIAILLVVLVLPLGGASTRTAGLSPGDSATYSYVFVTTNGITTNRSENMETVTVNWVNTTGSVGLVGYTLALTEFNNTVLDPPVVGSNYTAIFDPYVNITYFSQPWIGWYPFTYIDLNTGTVKNLGVNVTILNIPLPTGNVTAKGVVPVNTTVARSPGLIDINFSMATTTLQALFVMKFNSTTGWLERGDIYAEAFQTGRFFTYQLLNYTPGKPSLNYWYLAYAVPIAVVALLAYEFTRRRSRRERKASRIREKYTGRP